jgi:hypothetical protein
LNGTQGEDGEMAQNAFELDEQGQIARPEMASLSIPIN